MALLTHPASAESPTPFFSGTSLRFAWDQTSLGLLMECPRKYQLTILEGWFMREGGLHITFGKHFADAMELFHKLRAAEASFDEALDTVVWRAMTDTWDQETGLAWDSGDSKKNRQTLIRSIIWYFETYREDNLQTVILPSGAPAVELLFSFNSGISCPHGEFIFTGHIDRLVDFDSDVFVLDNKTTGAALGPYYFSQYDTDNQMSQYTLAGQVCYNVPVKGVIVDAAQIMVGFTAFGRGITTRTKAQLDEWQTNTAVWLDFAARLSTRLDLEPGFQFPMNLKSCGNYGGCLFKRVCGASPSMRAHILETFFEKRYWNPLDVR